MDFVRLLYTHVHTFTVAVLFAKRQIVKFQLCLQTRRRFKNISDKHRHKYIVCRQVACTADCLRPLLVRSTQHDYRRPLVSILWIQPAGNFKVAVS